MIIRISVIIALTVTFLSCGPTTVENTPPGVISGKFTLVNVEDPESPGVWFDFTAGGAVVERDAHKVGDFCLFKTFLRSSWPVTCGIQDSQADSLFRHIANPTYDYITPSEILKNADMPIYSGHVYYMITGEGLYARIKIVEEVFNPDATAYEHITFYWAYQPKGHEYFGVNPDGSPVEEDRPQGK
jgi:hypothetical protein